MTAAVFVDSTTLLYSQDRRDPRKQVRATEWLSALLLSGDLVVSVQVLNETYAVVRRKPEFAGWRAAVRSFLTDHLAFATRPLSGEDLQAAWDLEDRYRIGFWDALLLTSANDAGCAYFLSEDLNDGQLYGAVTAIDPFRHAPADVIGPALPA